MHVMRLMNKSSSIYSVHMRYFVHGNLRWSFTHLYGDDAGQGLACVGSSFNSDTQSAGALRHSHQSWHGLQQSGLSESRPLQRGKQKDENSMNWESSARQRHKRIRVRLSWRALPSETWQPNIKKQNKSHSRSFQKATTCTSTTASVKQYSLCIHIKRSLLSVQWDRRLFVFF